MDPPSSFLGHANFMVQPNEHIGGPSFMIPTDSLESQCKKNSIAATVSYVRQPGGHIKLGSFNFQGHHVARLVTPLSPEAFRGLTQTTEQFGLSPEVAGNVIRLFIANH